MDFVVIGGGAIGLLHAALLSRVANTTLLVRRQEQADALNRSGIITTHLDGSRSIDKVPATADVDCLDHADVVLVAVKGYDVEDVAKTLREHQGRFHTVIPMQNGFGHETALVKAVGKELVVWGMTQYGAERVNDAAVEIRYVNNGTMIGEEGGELSERVVSIGNLMSRAGIQVEVSHQIQSVLWSKFAQACCQNALSAITRKTFGALRESPHAVEILKRVSTEMMQLAKAEGVALLFDPYERQMEKWKGVKHRSSMLQDLDACRPTEIDHLNGMAVRLAAKHGLEMPVNRSLWLLTKAAEF